MSTFIRQNNLFAAEDWKKLYTTFRSADFQSYDYETLRKSMVDYIRTYYPEDFNDYIESSEFVALLDLISFMGQSISYRNDLNSRENFLQTAERRDSVYRLANMLGYSPNRNNSSSGMLKMTAISTTESIFDSNGVDLANRTIKWNDPTNLDWLEQFTSIINAALANNQRIGKPNSSLQIGTVRHDLYDFKTRNNLVPIINFSASIDNQNLPFNIYNVGLDSKTGLYEKAPVAGSTLGFVYKNSGEGNGSSNTGFFLGFKQGRINNLDFRISESLPNRLAGINVDNINNNDVWLFETNDQGEYLDEWTKVDVLRDSNVIYNDISENNRKIFEVYSRANDQIDLIFGDGVFSKIPVGQFRSVVRTSNGTSYTISPREMENIVVEMIYVNKYGKQEKLNFTLNLQYTVNNASTRESLTDIKVKAPQNFYTQNRMVNGEDYNTLPYIKFGDILKIKSVNRTSTGISRFLELKDVTGKYSSTNIFCEDGYVYKNDIKETDNFNWLTAADVQNFVVNTLSSILRSKGSVNLYFDKYPKISFSNTTWKRGSADSSTSSGFFEGYNDDTLSNYVHQVGESGQGERQYLKPGVVCKFVAPAGKFFDIDRVLTTGTPTKEGQVTKIWASIKSISGDGSSNGNGYLSGTSGPGPIVLTENIPNGAVLEEIYAVYVNNIDINLSQTLTRKIINNEDFGLRFDYQTGFWKIINPNDIATTGEFSIVYAGDTSGNNLDASWHVLMTNVGSGRYTTTYRNTELLWGSEIETRFYFDSKVRVYDSRNATVVKDQIRILTGNTLPNSSTLLDNQLVLEIYDTVKYVDGYRDDTRVKVTHGDKDNDGIPDNPEVFDVIADSEEKVYFEKYIDYDNFERYRYFDSNKVVSRYTDVATLNLEGRYAHPLGTVFEVNNDFYELTLVNNKRTIVASNNYQCYVGRDKLKFQYRHNAPNDRRIDPSKSNIIDMYVLTEAYNNEYRNWINDSSGTLIEPEKPTLLEMEVAYSELNKLKSVSDSITFNAANYKIIFGAKAAPEFQATFKVVPAERTRLSNSEIKSKVIKYINEYFNIENWDFGNTFYFSELSSFIHKSMIQEIGSIVIVPNASSKTFGDLFQIVSEPNEIFISSATVDDIKIVKNITGNQLKAPSSSVVSGGYTSN